MRLWIDAHRYGAALLRANDEPWLHPETLGMFCADLCGLLHPDRLLMPLAPLILRDLTAVGTNPHLRASALGNLIDSGVLANSLGIAMAAVQQTSVADSVVPILPGASVIAGGISDEDALDEIISHLGDLLRMLATLNPVAIMIAEPNERALHMASSLFRIASHLGLSLVPFGARDHPAATLCFPATSDAAVVGLGGAQSLGDIMGATPQSVMAGTQDLYLTLPPNASPEQVLARLATLRSVEVLT